MGGWRVGGPMNTTPWSRLAGTCALTTLLAACAEGPGPAGDLPDGDDTAAPPDLFPGPDDGADDPDAPADSGEPDTAGEDTAADTGAGDTGTGDTGSGDTGPAGDPATAPTCASFGAPEAVATVQDGALNEISGMVVSVANDGILWTLEDSGADPVLTAIDATGATRGTLTLEGVRAFDWEGLAIGPCDQGTCLVVGDVGDNALQRDTVQILRVPEPRVGAEPFALTATPEVVDARYPGGQAYNVEGVVVTPEGHAWMVTKNCDGTADVFALRDWDTTRTVDMEAVTTIAVGGGARDACATGADLSADGRTLLVRTYASLWTYPVGDGVVGDRTELDAASESQGEAVAWDPLRRGFWTISEGSNPEMWFAGCGE